MKCLQWYPAHDRSSVSSACQHTVRLTQPHTSLHTPSRGLHSQSCFLSGILFGGTLFLVLILQIWKQVQGTANPMSRGLEKVGPSSVSEPALLCTTVQVNGARHKLPNICDSPSSDLCPLPQGQPCTAQRAWQSA